MARRLSRWKASIHLGNVSRSPFYSVLLCGLVLPSAADAKPPCPDLSGNYRIVGKWVSSPDPNFDYAPPRVDEWAFAFVARKIIAPTTAVVSHNLAESVLLVDVLGSGVDSRWADAPKKLPFERRVACSSTGWHFAQVLKGGGDNTPSTMETRVTLSLDDEGNLTAMGQRDITSGYFIPTKRSSRWTALFTKLRP
jgi:hypothetical protein